MESPGKPFVVSQDRYSVTLGWSPYPMDKSNEKIVYTLQRKDRLEGWITIYWGFQTSTKVHDLGPGESSFFRLGVTRDGEQSPWSEKMAAATSGKHCGCTVVSLWHLAAAPGLNVKTCTQKQNDQKDQIAAVVLERAVLSGKTALIRKILISRPNAADVVGRSGVTPLMQAAMKGDAISVGLMISSGADVNMASVGAERTPLMIAVSCGHLEVAKRLIEAGATLDAMDRNGCTALHYAVDSSHLESLQFCLEQGSQLEARDNQLWTPLIRGVVLESSIEVLEELVRRGVNVNAVDCRRQTALLHAVLSGRAAVVAMLTAAGADAGVRNIFGNSALDIALSQRRKEIVPLISGDAMVNKEEKSKET